MRKGSNFEFGNKDDSRLSRLERLVTLSLLLHARQSEFEAPLKSESATAYLDKALQGDLPDVDFRRVEEMRRRMQDAFSLDTRRHGVTISDDDYAEMVRSGLRARALEDVRQKTATLQKEFHAFSAAYLLGLDTNQILLTRFITVRMYLGGDEALHGRWLTTVERVERLLDLIGFATSDEDLVEYGSIWHRFIARSKQTLTQPEVSQRLAEAEHALKLKLIEGQQAAINEKHAHAAAELLEALASYPVGVCQIGSLLLIKTVQGCAIRTLTTTEMMLLERKPGLLRKPDELLAALDGCDPS